MNKPVRVLHLSASDKGGAFIVADKLVTQFKDPGFEMVHAIYTGDRQNVSITGIRSIDNLLKFGLHAYEKFIFLFNEKSKIVRFKFSLGYPGIPLFLFKRLIAKYDIIHIHWINKGFINIRHLAKAGKPIVWTCHDIWAVTGGCHLTNGCNHYETGCGNCPYLKHPGQDDLSRRLFSVKHVLYQQLNITFVCPSEWMQQNLIRGPLSKGHSVVKINNGIDTGIFKPSVSGEPAVFTIGFVSANLNDENKALWRLAEAVKHLADGGDRDVKVILVGQKKADFQFSFPCEVEHIPFVDSAAAMADIYNRLNVLAVTSTMETFPTTLLEATACGTPGISFNIGGAAEILSVGTGVLAPAFDTEAYAQNLRNMKHEPHDRAKISALCHNRFGIAQVIAAHKSLYTSLLKQ